MHSQSAMRSPLKSPFMHHSVLAGACAGKWMDAKELLEFHQKVEEESLMSYDVLKAEESPTIRDLKLAARRVQDALILGLSFAYLPPPRVTCLISTVLPDYDGPCRCVGKVGQLGNAAQLENPIWTEVVKCCMCTACCRDKDCHSPETCCGNRLERMLDDPEGRLWRLRWPHHKNEQR